jgi:HEPN domain-containing protein
MELEKFQEIQQWLIKSERDLGAARFLCDSPESFLDVVVYHCQQSAEKSLKAYLTYQDVIFQKTHNLSSLLELCLEFDERFESLRDAAEILTPYATEFRYPGEIIEPEEEDVKEALEMAETVLSFVHDLLPWESPEVK